MTTKIVKKTICSFSISISNLVSSTSSIFSAKIDPVVCVDCVFWKELNNFYLHFISEESLVRDAGQCVHSSVSLVKVEYSIHVIKHLSALSNKFLTASILQ